MVQQDNLEVIKFMNKQVSNFAVLYIKLHRYHWFVQGEHFYELHRLFQEMYEEMALLMDDAAERILAIDGKPLATMSKYLDETSLEEASADDQPVEMLDRLRKDLETLADEYEAGREICDRHGDHVTSHLLTDWQSRMEKKIWMLKSALAVQLDKPEPARV